MRKRTKLCIMHLLSGLLELCFVAIGTIGAKCCCQRGWQQIDLYRGGFVLCFCGSGHLKLTFFGRGGWQQIDLDR